MCVLVGMRLCTDKYRQQLFPTIRNQYLGIFKRGKEEYLYSILFSKPAFNTFLLTN